MERLSIDPPSTHLFVLTGAGISVESGLSTYRAMDGLWKSHPIQDVATPHGFARDPGLSWRFWSERRAEATRAAPNPGHLALAAIERTLGDRFLLVTQNVDRLHQRAGSTRVVDLHGDLLRSRCTTCDRPRFDDQRLYERAEDAACDACATGLLRPDVVWFGEPIEQRDMDRAERFLANAAKERLIFLAVGTSGTVTPASAFVEEARRLGAETWLVNMEPPKNLAYFDHFIAGPSGEVLPRLFDEPSGSLR
jgi:NAD-dependent deacetylase